MYICGCGRVKKGRSREGAWIEIIVFNKDYKQELSRSREGAWIEMLLVTPLILYLRVAPVRERGLKCAEFNNDPRMLRRSREGAWIEMDAALNSIINVMSLP